MEVLLWQLAVVITFGASVVILAWLARRHASPVPPVTDRLILGIPWGSAIVLALVLLSYLLVQDGLTRWNQPVYYPYINWSYLHPTGVLFSAFTHASAPHLISNVSAAAVLAPLAEYIWGHYPDEEWSVDDPATWKRPHVRAFVLFPAAVLGVGLLTSLFAWGPVIGFSGVVFAFAGFTVIRYPLATVVALVVRQAIRQIGRAVADPIVVGRVGEELVRPWWAGVSVQGHVFGFLIGAFLGIALVHARRRPAPDPLRLWFGATLAMTTLSVWALWGGGGDEFVLYQGAGIALIFVFATLLTIATVASNRSLWGTLTRRHVAVMTFAIPILVIMILAVPVNLVGIAEQAPPEPSLSVEGYDVYYATDAERGLRPIIEIPGSEEFRPGSANGVIVVSQDRYVWIEAVSSTDLAFDGDAEVALGDLGWRSDVHATRTGWNPVGNESVYRVDLTADDGSSASFASPAREANVTVGGYRFSIDTAGEDFVVVLTGDGAESHVREIPDPGETVTVDELTIRHTDDMLVVESNGTRVPIASYEG